MSKYPYLSCLIAALSLKAVLVIALIISGVIGLGPDEAQYWTWSQELAFGYYSKPPGIAWQIAASAAAVGNSELGVRLGALLMGSLLSVAIYFLARACALSPLTCLWAGLAFALTPIGFGATFLAITDGGMILFWTLASVFVCSALQQNKPLPYRWIGLCILCGALFKWPIYTLWLWVAVAMIFMQDYRYKSLLQGVAISLLALLPTVVWNAESDWPTFRHVISTVVNPATANNAAVATATKGNIGEFIGSQMLLLSPIYAILLVGAFRALFARWRMLSPSLKWCAAVTIVSFGIYGSLSLFKKIQCNWVDLAYPTAIVLVCWYACEEMVKGRRWLAIAAVANVILLATAVSLPILSPHYPWAYKINPFKHNQGWQQLPQALAMGGYDADKHYLIADKYQTCSLLSFYGPKQQRAYFLNLQGIRKNQFSYWPGIPQEPKTVAFFVATEKAPQLQLRRQSAIENYTQQLSQYYSDVQWIGEFPLVQAPWDTLNGAWIFRCTGFKGAMPAESDLY